jgi:hypothetical protein
VRQELDATRDDVAAVLNDKQRARWDGMYDAVITHWLPPDTSSGSTTPASRSARTPDSPAPHTPPPAE